MLQKRYFVHQAVVVVVHLVNPALCNHLAWFVSRTPATFAHVKYSHAGRGHAQFGKNAKSIFEARLPIGYEATRNPTD